MNDRPGPTICRLCQQPRTLCDSHFLPAAFYKHLNFDETGTFQNKALLRLTKEKLARVPRQVKKHLLCSDCEGRFSEGGERWVSQFGYHVGRSFLLQDAVMQAPPRLTLSNGWAYHLDDVTGIDWHKLAYFALSVFWRGAADPWTPENGAQSFIAMPPALQENLRRFLLGEAGYPDDILLMLKLASGRTKEAHMMSFPSKGSLEGPGVTLLQYSFVIPGMIFTLVPGPGIEDAFIEQGCLIRGAGHPVHVMSTDDLFIREVMTLAATATPSKKVIEEVLTRFREAQAETE